MVADLVAFAEQALHKADVFRGLSADKKERALYVLLLQNVENPGCPLGVGAVIERNGNLVDAVAVVFDGIRPRINIHVLVDDELLSRVFLVGIHGDGALAGLRQTGNTHDVAFALDVEIVAWLDGVERLQRLRSAGLVPYVPHRIVFPSETP